MVKGSTSITRREKWTIGSLNSYQLKVESLISNPTCYVDLRICKASPLKGKRGKKELCYRLDPFFSLGIVKEFGSGLHQEKIYSAVNLNH